MLPEFDHAISSEHHQDRSAPQGGIAPDLSARSGLSENREQTTDNYSVADRGLVGVPGTYGAGVIFHTASAMRSLVDMGDAPSCATCGAIMTRNGSCYRCNECGSTSGCS